MIYANLILVIILAKMAQSLIDIQNNKLILNSKVSFNNTNKTIKVISIIGKARTGKSTFLNCLLTYWKTDSQNVFTMSNTGKHCTNGIDIYNIADQGIILLDFQGIYLGDSSNDPKLLLLAYLLSDVIIFNETKMLSNITLQQFEPMLSFINYMKGANDLTNFNPKLIFRISDMSLDIEPTTNMQDMLKYEDDQFQAIRECINDLFDNPYAVCTKNLDRTELTLLKQNKFREILENTDNDFDDAITKINEYLECCESRKTVSIFLEDLPKIIKNINDEKAIDFKKLDIVKSLGDHQIRDWIDSFGTDIYADIPVDGTSETYKNVIKRQEEMDKMLSNLHSTFKSIPKSIRDERVSIIKGRIVEKINKADCENQEKANTLMNGFLTKILLPANGVNVMYANIPINNDIDINNQQFSLDTLIKPITDKLEQIKTETEFIHNCAKMPFMVWKVKIIKELKTRIESEIYEHHTQIACCDKNIQKYYDYFNTNLDDEICKLVSGVPLHEPYANVLSKLKTDSLQKLNKLSEFVCKDIDIKGITVNCKNIKYIRLIINKLTERLPNVKTCVSTCDYTINEKIVKVSAYHKDFQILFDKYTKKLNELLDTKGTDIIAKYRNIELTKIGNLNNYKIDPNSTGLTTYSILFINNPKTQIISFKYTITTQAPNNCVYQEKAHYIHDYMTEDYYKQSLEPILLQTCNRLYKKGYMYNEDANEVNGWFKFLKDITDIQIIVPDVKVLIMSFDFYKQTFKNDYKRVAMAEIFENQFKKELIRKA